MATLKEDDHGWMKLAIQEARKCKAVDTAYNVGAVLRLHTKRETTLPSFLSSGVVACDSGLPFTTGFSREHSGNTHAEQVALAKWSDDDCVTAAMQDEEHLLTLYATMEPCSKRLSGMMPCTDRFLAWLTERHISKCERVRVVVGVREPSKFIKACKGMHKLMEAGLSVHCYEDICQDSFFVIDKDGGSGNVVYDIFRQCQSLNPP